MKYMKAIVAVLGAGVTAALGLGLSGTWQQVLTIAFALLTAAGVYAAPNTPAVPDAVKVLRAQQDQPTGGDMAG